MLFFPIFPLKISLFFPGRCNQFGLLQELIVEHLHQMVNKPWTEYSLKMCTLLLYLVKFNYYGSIDRMQGLIQPVLSALDRFFPQEATPKPVKI